MAATDQPYRSQKTLDLIFGLSCGALLFSTVWMFWADYAREFKVVQRTFRDVEAAIAERDMVDRMPDVNTVAAQRDALKEARQRLEQKQASVAPDDRRLKARYESLDAAYRDIKAEFDAQMSYYNIAVDKVGRVPEKSPRHEALKKEAQKEKDKLDRIEARLAEAKSRLDAVEQEIRTTVRAPLEPYEKEVADREEELKRTTSTFDRYAKQVAKTNWTLGDEIRRAPIIDGFASPTPIKQLWLPDLTIDYSFKEVPRFDRCTSCHLGIDRAAYDKDTLAKLGDEHESRRLSGKLASAQKVLLSRAKAGENLGFNPRDFPSERPVSFGKLGFIALGCLVVAAISLGLLQRSLRLMVVTMLVGLSLTLLSTGAIYAFYAWGPERVVEQMAPPPVVKAVKLTDGQVTQYCAHPRLDLFVDSNSPHPMEKFGCTTCHAGQGSATDFINAAHTPDGALQEKAWRKRYGWETPHAGEFPPNYHWDYPMLQKRFLESACLKCHHQVTDLIRNGAKEEAPKLLRGYNLIKENGCFGCHEIQGVKGGRWIGPDLRSEPAPALAWLSAADQERIKGDTANPPGGLRKVGPSLRRLSEKVSEEWTRRWIDSPRGFREDTRMPHFYHLANNQEKELPEAQKKFPSAEIHAISYYLMEESRRHLKGDDFYRKVLLSGKKNISEMQRELVKAPLSDRDIKDLYDLSKRFADLALLSNPAQATAINAHAASQRQLQERLQELHRKQAQGGDVKADLDSAARELEGVTEALRKFAVATPIASNGKVVGEDGSPVELPRGAGDAANGRTLFVERGCLACHSHEKTATAGKTPAVTSEANFGPELSRMADKLLMADGKAKADEEKARRWLVQWIMNPNVHHPRTRMPVTHLSAKDANDIAAWILSQKTGWKGTEVPAPDDAAVRALARLNLLRAPGFTKADVDAFLPAEGKIPGIPKDRAAALPRDADERELAEGTLSDSKLLWYIGKRAVGRLGCYGCHDIPGFETAKPIGTGLNDWGKKDHDKLAFEDGEAFAKEHYTVVPSRFTRRQAEARILALWRKGGESLSDEARGDDKSPRAQFADWLGEVKNVGKAKGNDLLTRAVASLGKDEQDELARLQKALDPETQKRIGELERKKLDEGLTSAEKKEYEELHPLQFFEEANGKPPVEEAFFEALEHHHREGFLHLKLLEPRSYDHNRIRPWDERLRMPQFKFARSRRLASERPRDVPNPDDKEEVAAFEKDRDAWRKQERDRADARYRARLEVEEAEAREAVMTFILGLVAEPVPLKYVNNSRPEKAAEVVGRQVLDKYNCGGCHQIRPGVFEFKYEDAIRMIEKGHGSPGFKSNLQDDYHFPNTNAWAGPAQSGDRMTALGYFDAKKTAANQETEGYEGSAVIRLSEAFRFTGADKVEKNVPAGADLLLPQGRFRESAPYGGTWTELMIPYLMSKDPTKYPKEDAGKSRSVLPPPLVREGERVQPDWLYKFLLNPGVVRPEGYMLTRMPKFNMSPDESRALVNYFAAVAKTTNPGQGVTYPYLQVPQREKEFWRHAAEEYDLRLARATLDVDRTKDAIKKAEEDAKDAKKKEEATKRLEGLKKDLAAAEARAANAKAQRDEKPAAGLKVATDLYSRQAYKLLTNRELCLKCHNIGNIVIEGPQGPNLALAAERLRPEWMEQWIAKPPRMFTYDPVMPQNFPNKPDPLQWVEQKTFVGTPLQQTRAVRDILMDGARLSDLLTHSPPPAPAPADKDKPKEKDKDKK